MKIQFPLLSILSVCVLLFFGFQGDVELYSWEVGFSATSEEVRVTIDPTFAIWVPHALVYGIGCNALTCGNVMVLDEKRRNTIYGTYLLAYEGNHVEQFRALGLLFFPARYVINTAPPKSITTNWYDPSQPDRTMWLPPSWWVDQWHFITLVRSRSP